MPSLTLKELSKSYSRHSVIPKLSATITDGEYFVLMGSSGCGKSTLLRLIAGLEKPDNGEIYFGEANVTQKEPQDRNVSFVFQNYALWPHLKVKDNIGFSLDVKKVSSKEKNDLIQSIAHLTNIESELEKYPGQLSGGQQQRVSVARGLIYSPALLLLDEPLSNLDPQLRESMRRELKNLQKRIGVTTIHVTHDRDEALTLADRIGIMKQGELIQVATPEEIYHSPVSTYAAQLLGECNSIHGDVVDSEQISTEFGALKTRKHSCSGKVTALLRPHDILFQKKENNSFPITITSQEYFGHSYKIHFKIGAVSLFGYSPTKIPSSESFALLPSDSIIVTKD